MAGIYIHIPFCKQACYYCDFHFSTSMKRKNDVVSCIIREIEMRKNELQNEVVETIYFGGGTPSLLSQNEIDTIIDAVHNCHTVDRPEITLEANPDDLSEEKIKELASSKVNRLSIGIQSFFEHDLKLMNRAHNSEEAKKCLEIATQYFDNISLDLIYGIPGASNEQWEENIDIALGFNVPHISSYALTVEPKTALANFVEKEIIPDVDDEQAEIQFFMLIDKLDAAGFIHYETSNFGKEGYLSRNNSAYWQGKNYIGLGPSAHSYNGRERSWNIRNNAKYVRAIQNNELPIERETLTKKDSYNEYVMTGLRTIWGVSMDKVETDYGKKYRTYLEKQSEKYIQEELLYIHNGNLKTSEKGKFLSDGIASDLFMLNLK